MQYLSRWDIEQIGIRVTEAYQKLPAVEGPPFLRVDIELLTARVLGLKVEAHHLSRDRETLGVTSFCEIGVEVFDSGDGTEQFAELDGRTIFIERDLLKEDAVIGRKNFTIAHESSHHILKMLYPRDYGLRYRRGGLLRYRLESGGAASDWEAWQANALASAILLPADCVRNSMLKFGLGDRMKRLNRVFSPREYERFAEMAAYMGVSKTALAIRMTQLGLLEQNYLGRPYDLVNITMEEGA